MIITHRILVVLILFVVCLGGFAGQTVRIQFRATNDITLPTSFRLDDVTVQ